MSVLATTLDAAKSKLETFEKNVPWMYMDNATPQRVTVGVGNMFPDAKSAEALWDKFEVVQGYSKNVKGKEGMASPRKLDEYCREYRAANLKSPQLKFANRAEEEKWMKGVISKVYSAVKQAANPKLGAYGYIDANKVSDPAFGEIWLRFKEAAGINLMKVRVDEEFIPQLRGKLTDAKGNPYYDHLPPEAQQALIDLTYNAGIKNLLKFKEMLTAIQEKDWKKAAEESKRKNVEPDRNKYVKELFLKLVEPAAVPEVVQPKPLPEPAKVLR
jgi:GH24 family phage-related lysozyme (muramidase)